MRKIVVSILILSLILGGLASCNVAISKEDTSTDSVQEESQQEIKTDTESSEFVTDNTDSPPETETENIYGTNVDETTGASTIVELANLLENDYLFTPKQVDCMGVEFLFACISFADPVNARDIFATRDTEAIASLLNEKLFQAINSRPYKYHATEYQTVQLTDEIRQQTQAWFMMNYSQVVEEQGEYFAQKVSEENEGREQIIYVKYTATYEDGTEVSLPENNTDGLNFSAVNGRYYWNDFSIFQ